MTSVAVLLVIAGHGLPSAGEPAPDITTVPMTYVIDYAADHLDNPQYLETVSAAPPDILHVGHDVVFKSHLGPYRGTSAFPKPYERLPATECVSEIERVKGFVDSLHRAGVRTVLPYICDVLIFGDHIERRGFWEFYDRWEEYESLGFGEKPAADPIQWMQSSERRPTGQSDLFVYHPCINAPEWQRYLRAIVRLVGRCGYDGVFVDVNSYRCGNTCCRSLFAKYLNNRYSAQELNRLFGIVSPDSVRLGDDGDGLLAVETYRFRAQSMAELFAILRQEGESLRPGFLVVPNLSPMAHIDGVRKRIGNGQDVGRWAGAVPWLMYEEMQQSGLFGTDLVSDCTLQYKLALASGIRGGMLLYHATDRDGIALAMAEAGAGGGGGLIQPGYACPKVRLQYGDFWLEHRDLFDGLHPYSQIGVCYFRDELYWGNLDHLHAVYRVRRHLSEAHVLFDFVVEQNFSSGTLSQYQAVIVPAVCYLTDRQIEVFRDYVSQGGLLVVVGSSGRFDELGQQRPLPALREWHTTGIREGEISSFEVGKGHVMLADGIDAFIPSAPFELFDLSEDDANEIDIVMKHASKAPARTGEDSPLLHRVTSVLGTDLALTGRMTPNTVRVAAYTKKSVRGGIIMAHIVNYNVPIHGKSTSGPPVDVEELSLRIPVPLGRRISSVEALAPGEEIQPLPFAETDGCVRVTVPRVSIYKVVRVCWDFGSNPGN